MGYPFLLVPDNVTKEKRRAGVGLLLVEEKIRVDASLPSAEKRMGQEKRRAESTKKTREWMPRTRGGSGWSHRTPSETTLFSGTCFIC
jgi:hypothetical protein